MATINGTNNSEHLNGTALADQINSLVGDDTLVGNGGADRLVGGVGEDHFAGGAGNDTLDGSDRPVELIDVVDEVTYFDATGAVVVQLRAGVAVGNASVGRDTLIDIESVYGSSFSDILWGGLGANEAYEGYIGLRGNDTINGGSGFDEVRYDLDRAFGGAGGISPTLSLARSRMALAISIRSRSWKASVAHCCETASLGMARTTGSAAMAAMTF